MVSGEPELYIRDLLRTRLTDPQTSRPATDSYVQIDWPQHDSLLLTNYPRISIIKTNESSVPWGLGSTVLWTSYRMQIEVFVKPDNILSISSTNYEGKELCLKISRDVEEALRQYWITDLAQTDKLILLTSYNVYSPSYNYEYRFWRQMSDITMRNKRS